MTSANAVRRGAFIVFEGGDRSGKSTQCARLLDALKAKDIPAELWRYPDRTTETGKMINSYLSNQSELDDFAVHLLFAANRWEKRSLMEKTLNEGTTLVVDRYSYSGVAFTSAKKTPGLDLEWCKAPEKGLIAPDVVLYLQVPVDVAAKRGGYGEERYEKAEFQKTVGEQFEQLKDDKWHVIDASADLDTVTEQVQAKALQVVGECMAGKVEQTNLW
eukprot:CAMPEP_0197848984 /NCGR_PEP_ID=MMETSP1438-20131217/10576_1 /TAXON_ID=1461541 /ORGANISM="Pterosperma sp., Strain CCMP1384" /LENGTH=216 /DNA_ID=CAMNT_0043461473 /DNA_START=121 /DNA_END=771 /DNA_ORIENTATION=-